MKRQIKGTFALRAFSDARWSARLSVVRRSRLNQWTTAPWTLILFRAGAVESIVSESTSIGRGISLLLYCSDRALDISGG